MKRAFGLVLASAILLSGPAARADDDVAHTVLSPADVKTYGAIFAAQKAGQIAKADAAIKKLDDKSLMGYVLEQRYLLPKGYRAKFAELKSWMQNYGDLFDAARVYKLAVKRAPKKTAVPGPQPIHWRGANQEPEAYTDTPLQSVKAQQTGVKLRALEREGNPEAADALLTNLMAGPGLPQADLDRLAAYVAAAYLAEAKDMQALTLAEEVIARGSANAPLCHWTAGLAAYRMGQYEAAAHHFEAIAQSSDSDAKTYSGGFFWAARSWQQAYHPEKVMALYARAAQTPNTFYGLLAARLLGRSTMSMTDPALDTVSFARLTENKAAHRAVALWQIGRNDAVEYELGRAFGDIDPSLDPAFAALARHLEAPALELRAAETSSKRDIYLTSLYPIPPYSPKGGYTLDKAVILAFARQESRFQPAAQSKAGAMGLMQIMPATAAVITHDKTLNGANKERLTDPEYSMTLGQEYLLDLLDRQNGNLFALAAAYNAGLGNLTKWTALHEGNNDPLLFIESIPAAETRAYVKRVAMNVWMYRQRLGETADGLDETASGDWPVYMEAGNAEAGH